MASNTLINATRGPSKPHCDIEYRSDRPRAMRPGPLPFAELWRLTGILKIIQHDIAGLLAAAEQGSWTQRAAQRAAKHLARFAKKLGVDMAGHPLLRRDYSAGELCAIFDFAVIDIISGHVRCPVIDAALKCGRALFELKIAAEEAAHSRCRAPCPRARPRVVVAHQRRPFLEVIGGGRAPERV
jgi:hypothetical protein